MTSLKTQGLLFVSSLALLLVLAVPAIQNLSGTITPESNFTVHVTAETSTQLQLEPITKTGAFLLEITNNGKYAAIVEFSNTAQVVSWYKTNRQTASQSGASTLQSYQLQPGTGLTVNQTSTVSSIRVRNQNAVPLLLGYTWVDLRNTTTTRGNVGGNNTLFLLESSK